MDTSCSLKFVASEETKTAAAKIDFSDASISHCIHRLTNSRLYINSKKHDGMHPLCIYRPRAQTEAT